MVRAGAGQTTDGPAPLVGSFDDIPADLADLAAKAVTETFVDLNGRRTDGVDGRAHEATGALAPARVGCQRPFTRISPGVEPTGGGDVEGVAFRA
jgi:hypothetical protein